MGAVSPQTISRAGLTPVYSAVSASDTFVCPNDRRTYLEVVNAGGSPDTVAIAPVQASVHTSIAGDLAVSAISVVVPATTGRKKIGPIPSAYVNAGIVTVTHSFTTSVTQGVFVLPDN